MNSPLSLAPADRSREGIVTLAKATGLSPELITFPDTLNCARVSRVKHARKIKGKIKIRMNTARLLLHPLARLKGWYKRPQMSLTAYGIVYEMWKYAKPLSLIIRE